MVIQPGYFFESGMVRMERIEPDVSLKKYACSIVAVTCALGHVPDNLPTLRNNGWATLNVANKFIRAYLPVQKRIDYKRGMRPQLKELHIHGRAIVCVYGHLLYLDHETYYSFFDNQDDEVVVVWLLNDQDMLC